MCDVCFLEKLTENDQRPRASTLDASRLMAGKKSSVGLLQYPERFETKRSVSWHPGDPSNGASPVNAQRTAIQKTLSWHPGHPGNGGYSDDAAAKAIRKTADNVI